MYFIYDEIDMMANQLHELNYPIKESKNFYHIKMLFLRSQRFLS